MFLKILPSLGLCSEELNETEEKVFENTVVKGQNTHFLTLFSHSSRENFHVLND